MAEEEQVSLGKLHRHFLTVAGQPSRACRAAQLHRLSTHPSAACRHCRVPGRSGRPPARYRTGSFPGCSLRCAPCRQQPQNAQPPNTQPGTGNTSHMGCSPGSLAGAAGEQAQQAGMLCAAHVANRPSRPTAVVPTTTSSLSPISLLYRCRQAVQGSSPVQPSAQYWTKGGHSLSAAVGPNQLRQREIAATDSGSLRHLHNGSSLSIFGKV